MDIAEITRCIFHQDTNDKRGMRLLSKQLIEIAHHLLEIYIVDYNIEHLKSIIYMVAMATHVLWYQDLN